MITYDQEVKPGKEIRMNINPYILPGILCIVILGFGFWTSRSGKPYPGSLFNIHKLAALGGVVLVVIRAVQLDLLAKFSNPGWVWGAAAVLAVMALFGSGAALSIREGDSPVFRRIHQVGIGLLLVSGAGLVYLLS